MMVAPFIRVENNRRKTNFVRKFISSVLDIFTFTCLWDIQIEMINDQLSFEISLGIAFGNDKSRER